MENASKALIMAGGILIALLVISLLVMFYGNIKNLMSANYNTDVTEQVAEFNKQYDVYYRDNLYGSDILSIANKVYDYNKREYEEQGYARLDIEVTIKSKIMAYNSEIIVDSKQKYNADALKQKKEYLDNNIQKYVEQEVSGKTIEALSGLRTNELEELFKTEIEKNKNFIEEKVQPKIDRYLSYKSALATLKSKTFKAEKFEYDNSTGRITLMKFVENK